MMTNNHDIRAHQEQNQMSSSAIYEMVSESRVEPILQHRRRHKNYVR
jgi:hypothetical protein